MNELSVQDVVIAVLGEMGQYPAPGTLVCTFALSEGCLVAQKFFYEGGYAVWVASRGTVSFYDDAGKMLKTISLQETNKKIAA